MSRPASSKNRITTDWGSSWASRTVSPPRAVGRRMMKRVTGTDATSRSSTFTPTALSPAIIARLSMRAERLESREVITVPPFLSMPP